MPRGAATARSAAAAGRYSKASYKRYDLVGRALQRMKRASKIEYVIGKGAGWRIVKAGRRG